MKRKKEKVHISMQKYCLKFSSPLQHKIVKVLDETEKQFGPRLLSSVQVLQLNSFIIKITNAVKVLDIGVYTGASALTSALALPDNGTVYALEKSNKFAKIAQENIINAGVASKLQLMVGDALDSLDDLRRKGHEGTFDFCYIDADKKNYTTYFDQSLHLLKPGGVIAVDNTLYRGLVLGDADKVGNWINLANKHFIESRSVEGLLLNVGDGYSLFRKLAHI